MTFAFCVGGARTQLPYSIDDFGALAGVDTHAAAVRNGAAFAAAVVKANSSSAVERAVLVPAGSTYAFMPDSPTISGLANVTIFVEGTLQLYTANFSANWPGYAERTPWMPLSFSSCSALTITSQAGAGRVDARGNEWWWSTILSGRDIRPRAVLEVDNTVGMEISGLTLTNAPMFHVNVVSSRSVLVSGVTVRVDVEDQLAVYSYVGAIDDGAAGAAATERGRVARVMRAAGKIGPVSPQEAEEVAAAARRAPAELLAARRRLLPAHFSARTHQWFDERWRITPPFPMVYALNTDGIDVSGEDIVVRNSTVTNFDDTVCAKPQLGCSRNYLIEDINVFWGCGLSMGSVPPDPGNNCISGALVRRVTFNSPLKGIYVKPNPPKTTPGAVGEISNITYEDVKAYDPVWWPIWIGPQQQHQPGYNGTGCQFLYPLYNTSCPTDPEVSVFNITLRRVDFYNGPSPGVLLMNASNPARNVLFEDVVHHNASAFPVGSEYLCTAVSGAANGTTSPVPPCLIDETEREA